MKKFIFIIVALAVTVYLFGCVKKEQPTRAVDTKIRTPDSQPISNRGVYNNMPSGVLEIIFRMDTEEQQNKLKDLGYYGAKDFQRASGLKVDGIVGPETSWALFGKDIQAALKNAGFYFGKIDGKIKSEIKTAIEKFQKAKDLKVDGKIGIKTWRELKKYLNPPAEQQTKKKR